MRILQVTNFFKPSWEAGGPPRVVFEISRRLAIMGHDVTVFTTDGFKERQDVISNKPVEVDGIRTFYFKNLSSRLAGKVSLTPYYAPVAARRETKYFDVIHIHELGLLGPIVHHYATKYGIPYMLQTHGGMMGLAEKKSLLGHAYSMFLERPLVRDATKVFALTKSEAFQCIQAKIPERKIEIVPNGIDMLEYQNLPRKGKFRERFGFSEDEKVILYLGRLHETKRIDFLVDAFSELKYPFGKTRLAIVGPDDGFLSTLIEKVSALELEDRVVFTGPLYGGDKIEAYLDSDVCVLPSKNEAFPITVLEAWACGTPVIVHEGCGIADFVREAGYVVGYDRTQLQNTITTILSGGAIRETLAGQARKIVEKEFNWSRIVDRIERIYEDARRKT